MLLSVFIIVMFCGVPLIEILVRRYKESHWISKKT